MGVLGHDQRDAVVLPDRRGAGGAGNLAVVRQRHRQRQQAQDDDPRMAAPLPDLGHRHRRVRDADRVPADDRGDRRQDRTVGRDPARRDRSRTLRRTDRRGASAHRRLRRIVPDAGRAELFLRPVERGGLDRRDRAPAAQGRRRARDGGRVRPAVRPAVHDPAARRGRAPLHVRGDLGDRDLSRGGRARPHPRPLGTGDRRDRRQGGTRRVPVSRGAGRLVQL